MAEGTAASRVTHEKEQAFLELFRTNGNVTESAREVGHSRMTFYRHREKDREFAEQWDAALEEATELLEKEVRRRGCEGWLEPVFYQGKQTSVVRKYSDNLLMFLLKKRNPEFRDSANITLAGQLGATINVITEVPGAPNSDG